MSEDAKPSIIASAVAAWRDGFAAASRMGTMMITAFLLMLAVIAVNLPFLPPEDGSDPGIGFHLIGLAVNIAQGFLIAPFAIAVHRNVLLGDVTPNYSLNPSDPRFMRFFGFTVALNLLMVIPSFGIMAVTAMAGPGSTSGYGLFGLIMAAVAVIALLVGVIIVALRSIILFPAIAVDAPAVKWGNALCDSQGHSWRIFFIMLVTMLPMMIAYIPIYMVLFRSSNWLVVAAGVVIAAAFTAVSVAAMAAMASRLYFAFGSRLGRPPGLRIADPAPA